MMQTSIAPGLLLAMPQLVDPNFTRSVVLMIEHNDRGSFGLLVNQPYGLSASELLDSLDMDWCGDEDEVVWRGGPVQPNTGWILHEPVKGVRSDSDDPGESGSVLVRPDLALSTAPHILRTLGRHPPARMRLLLGYSGWGPGQLAGEMARGSWLHADLDLEILFHTPADEMWARALRTLGIEPEAVVQGFGIH